MSLATGGWCHLNWELETYAGNNPVCAVSWKGRFFFGSWSGQIFVNEGTEDQSLSSPAQRTSINCSVIPGFTDAGTASEKRALMVRPNTTTIVSFAYMEPSQSGTGPFRGTVMVLTDLNAWTGINANRAGLRPEKQYITGWVGGSGIGEFLSVLYAFQPSTGYKASLNGIDLLYDVGGVL